MAVVGWEWIAIAGVLIILLLWGSKKIPEFPRAIRQARQELVNASKESTAPSEEKSVATGPEDTLIDTAKRLGIATEGKTRDEISREIVQRVGTSKSTASTA